MGFRSSLDLPVPITTENNFKSNVRFRRQTARLESGDLLLDKRIDNHLQRYQ